MSATPSIDAYDAQMLDFSSDPDVPMHITGTAEFFTEALMDHDGHLSLSTYGEHASVEVDMEEYVGDNAEYEMADETAEYHRSHPDELLDIEVYDASHAPSPLVPSQSLQPSIDAPIDSENPASASLAYSEQAVLPESQSAQQSEVHPAPSDHQVADVVHVEPLDGLSSEAISSELSHPADVPDGNALPVSESYEQICDATRPNAQLLGTLTPVDAIDEAPYVHPAADEFPANSEVTRHEDPEPPTAESAPLASAEEAYYSGPLAQDEKAADQTSVTEGVAVDPLRISDGVYIEPPPAVLLSIVDLDQPEFVLFNQHIVEDESTGGPQTERGTCSLILENQPTLYYESLSNLFEALRQDDALLSRVPYSFEGELILDAYDLQLAVSEDNVHSRDICLHDLNVLHDGSNIAGPLRLLLRANVPRFIIRYYALQEQIQRLGVAAETGEGEQDEEHNDQYGAIEERHLPQQEEGAEYPSHPTVDSELQEVAPVAEVEPVNEVDTIETTEETVEENPEDTTGLRELAEYQEATEEARVLEDEDDYEGTNVGGEDESAKSETLDADLVHDTVAEDTDAAATVTGRGSEFGGEQTEYLDDVQPEEYDERYGEELPERVGGAAPVQYGEPSHYEEEGEQDTSTVADESRVILPGSDEDNEDTSFATPVPPRVDLEPESSGFTDKVTDTAKQDDLNPSGKELTTSESTQEVTNQTSGNQEPDTAREQVFTEVDESDSNFVSVLEREAEAEFDETFITEQNGHESSIEATLLDDSTWEDWADEDAEGVDEEDCIDPEAASNESSATLSSKASSKRCFDEVDPSEAAYVEDPQPSPGSKRPRVQ